MGGLEGTLQDFMDFKAPFINFSFLLKVGLSYSKKIILFVSVRAL